MPNFNFAYWTSKNPILDPTGKNALKSLCNLKRAIGKYAGFAYEKSWAQYREIAEGIFAAFRVRFSAETFTFAVVRHDGPATRIPVLPIDTRPCQVLQI